MTKRLNSVMTGVARIMCCLAVLLSGCANLAPTAETPSTTATPESLPSLRISGQHTKPEAAPDAWQPVRDDTLPKVEISDQPSLPQAIDLTVDPDDLFQRIRHGFSMPDLNDDLVLHHQQWYMNRPDYLRRMVDRSSRYLHHIVDELEKRGMPTELALLPMVESAYNPMAYSRAKASGLWQFIPATGKRYNLEQDWWKDERRDIVASTSAALEYLQSIYEMHGDWHLALASYNWGEGAVGRAIGKNRAQGLPTDYLSLTMPTETRNYVPKLQALKNIFGNNAVLAGLDLPKVPNRPFFATVTTDSHIDIKVAAKLAEMPVQEFVALNPAHNRPVIQSETPLVIPAEKLETFVNNLEAHGEDNKPLSAWQTYTFRRGDTLEKIARRFGMTVAALKAANGIKARTRVSPGLTLLVAGQDRGKTLDMAALPEQPQLPESNPPPRGNTAPVSVHSVRKGETLAAIARRYGTSIAELRRTNNLRNDRLLAGTQLKIAAAPPSVSKTAGNVNATTVRAANKGATSPAATPRLRNPAQPSKTTHYTVRQGDTMYSIARQFKVAVDDLLRWNRLSSSALKPGTQLTIQLAQNP